ncbi:hypothetical protein C2L96_04385 [Bacillus cereus]|nr:hypothetical protein CMV37_24570 [Bacillus cereus]PKF98409.1 hypothetical protein CW365_17040 [Bacillus cereus]PNU17310.1 hypothetical protein C2L96_04385 [Bacillus cereus]
MDYIRSFNSARSSLDVNRTSHVTYIISTASLNKTQYSVNNIDDIRFFSLFPLGEEQLVFANCSFIYNNDKILYNDSSLFLNIRSLGFPLIVL